MSLSKYKVLLLNVNREGWHSGNMLYDMQCIEQACDTVLYGPGFPNYKASDLGEIIRQVYGDEKPDLIYSYFTPNEKVGDVYINHYSIPKELHHFPTGFDKVKGVRKVFAISDFWSRSANQYSNDLDGADFDHIFCCFTPPYSKPSRFYAFFDDKIKDRMTFHAHLRCVDKNCYKDYGLEKKHDVITVGAMGNFYKLRVLMRNGLEKHAEKRGIDYKNYGYCGSNFRHNGFVRDTYAKAINESRMLLSCGGRYHLLFNKVFESMGCNTVYVGERPFGYQGIGLVDGETYIEVNSENYLDKIEYYSKNPKETEKIAKSGRDLFLEKHTIEARAKDFVNLLQEIEL